MEFTHFSHNGKILPVSQAHVPLANLEYSYGFGVYETLRCSKGTVYFIDDHVARLLASAVIIGLEHEFSAAPVKQSLLDLVERTNSPAFNLKVLLIGAPQASGAQLFVQCLKPLFPDRKLYQHGAALITQHCERVYPHAKSLNMLPSYIAYANAKRAGAYDALLVNRAGHITEGTRTNFFGLRGKMIYSPREDDILLGVTRQAVLSAAAGDGFKTVQADIAPDDLPSYDAAFITSTSSKIIPVRSVDGVVLNETPPPLLRRLMDIFEIVLAN